MWGRAWFAVAAGVIFGAWGSIPTAGSQELGALTVEEVVQRVIVSDPGIISARRGVESAEQGYLLERAALLPNLSLSVSPYTWDQRVVESGTRTRVRTHSVGVGVGVQQSLPTSGLVTMDLSNETSFIDDGAARIDQQPTASLSVSQPLFVNGKVISTDVYRAGVRVQQLAVEGAGERYRLTINANVQQALQLYVEVANLRRGIGLLQETIKVLQAQLESAQIDRQQGLISDTALLSLQVALNTRRETLFSRQLILLQTEQALSRVTDLPNIEGREIADLPELSGFSGGSSPSSSEIYDNPMVALQRVGVAQSRERGVLNELVDRPVFGMSLRVEPTYPETDARGDLEGFADSFADLFADGAELATTVAFELRVPLVGRRERAYRERIDELNALVAQDMLSDSERTTVNRLQTALRNREFLSQRVELLRTDVEYERRRVESERLLLETGATTQLRVQEVELDLLSRRNELSEVQGELFLNTVEVMATIGEDLPSFLGLREQL